MACVPVHALTTAVHSIIVCTAASASPSWLAPIVTVATGLVGGYIALQSIDNARQLARRKATLDLIEKVESAEHYRTLTDAFTAIRRANGFAHIVKPTDDASKKLRGQVLDYLNHYELVAIGIRKEILDAGMYRDWMATAFVRDWNAVADWVQSVRVISDTGRPGYNPKAFSNFQMMAREWAPRRAIWLTPQSPPLVRVDAPAGVTGDL